MRKGKRYSHVYVITLFLRGKGTLERIERNNEVLARVTFDELRKEACDCEFGKGKYVVAISEQIVDEEGNIDYHKVLEKIVIENGPVTLNHLMF